VNITEEGGKFLLFFYSLKMTNAITNCFSYSAEDIASVSKLCRENHTKLVLGIDVGIRNLALWMGCLDVPAKSQAGYAKRLAHIRVYTVFWLHANCPKSDTLKPTRQVQEVLKQYYDTALRYAHAVVIEKQHKRNGRMKHLARAIHTFFSERGHRLVRYRPAWEKFKRVCWLPTPMPAEKLQRKEAAESGGLAFLAYMKKRGTLANAADVLNFVQSLRVQLHDIFDAFFTAVDYLLDDVAVMARLAADPELIAAELRDRKPVQRRQKRRRKKKRKQLHGDSVYGLSLISDDQQLLDGVRKRRKYAPPQGTFQIANRSGKF
jgi:hypothetical protein